MQVPTSVTNQMIKCAFLLLSFCAAQQSLAHPTELNDQISNLHLSQVHQLGNLLFAQAKRSSSTIDLGDRLLQIEHEKTIDNSIDKTNEISEAISKLISNQTEEGNMLLSRILIESASMPVSYVQLIHQLGSQNPSFLFKLAERASQQLPAQTSPATLFKPAIDSQIFKVMSQRDQNYYSQGAMATEIRLYAIAALSAANYDIADDVIKSIPSAILFAGLIDALDQGESLWCGDSQVVSRSNRLVAFSNRILRKLAPQYLPSIEAAAKKSNNPYSEALQAQRILKGALAETNLNQPCPGCCGSWGMIFDGIFNILKPTQ